MSARLLAAGICCLALGTLRCGTTSPAATGSTGTPQADAGSGGGSGGGGSTDGGSGGGGGTTDGGSGGGGGTTDGGSGGGGGGDVDGGSGGGSGGGGDADGGTAGNECDGLSADPHAASILINPPAGLCGASSMSDLSGNIAISRGANTSDARQWATYDRTGARLGALHMFSPPIPRNSGFFGLDDWSGPDPRADAYHLWTFEPDGSGPSQSVGNYMCNSFIYRSSAGGVILTGTCGAGINIASRVVWYDDSGAEKWRTWVDAYPVLAAVGDSAGNVLIAAQSSVVRGHSGSDLLGQWIAPDGKIASDWFVLVAGEEAVPTLQAMIGGGAFVMQLGRWAAVVPPMGRPQPPPDWLVARPEQELRIVRGRKAYAFTARIPQPHGIPGGPMVEVVTPTGKSCGTFDTKGIAATVGGDGTVIATTSDGCTRRVWPALLGIR